MSSTYTGSVLNHPYSGRSRSATDVTSTTVFVAETKSSTNIYISNHHTKSEHEKYAYKI
jgi:hypothetical protein